MKKTNFKTPPQAAEYLTVSPNHIRRWIEAGELEAVNLGSGSKPYWKISEKALVDFLESRTRKASQ